MKTAPLYAIVLIAMLVLAGCASMVTPKTPDQTVYATYGLYVAVADTAADLVATGSVTSERGQAVQDTLHTLRPQIDAAKAMVDDGEMLPDDRLDVIRAIQQQLLALQRRLQQEAGK